MKKKPVLFILLFAGAVLLMFLLMQPLEIRHGGELIVILFPKGKIALEQRNMLLVLQAIMLLVVIPVYILTFLFSWIYRADNSKAKYEPNMRDHPIAEIIWWGLPCIIIIVIGVFTWIKTYELDPFRPIVSDKEPMTIQVVALQWKWLFIYPDENVASLNYVQFPKQTPIHFEITSDAPMNSFWIPALGGQIYAMPKMKTQLNLIADEAGNFRGSSANISGDGFAGMHFIAEASTDEDFQEWIKEAKASPNVLGFEEYSRLAKPSKNEPAAIYQLKENNLFDQIIMKYMQPHEMKE